MIIVFVVCSKNIKKPYDMVRYEANIQFGSDD